MMTSIDRVPHALAHALAARGYLALTPVQRAVLAVEPQTRDMLVSAETGSGKTVAFGLALAGGLLAPDGRAFAGAAPRAAVVTPTRELALQVRRELAWLYAETGARVVCCAGGMDMRIERARLEAGCEIAVGSPGRLRDHVERGSLDMAAVGCVVLDEADDMLDMGFREDLEFLLRAAGSARRTLMFSATVSKCVEALAARFQTDAVRVNAAGGASADIRFEAVAVAPSDRENAIAGILRRHGGRGAIVFCSTREGVARLATRLGDRGFKVVALSGALPQRERNAAIAALRNGRARVCVATDLAARGLDLPRLELVVHADLPANAVTMTHRSGRTGRAGRKGLAIFVVPHPQRRRAAMLAVRAGVELQWVRAPSPEAIPARGETRDPGDSAPENEIPREERAAERKRATPEPPIGSTGDRARTARRRMENGVWFSLDRGRAIAAEPRWLLALICRIGRVHKKDVGRIVIGERETRFEISARAAERFSAAAAWPGGADASIRRVVAPDPGGCPLGVAWEPPKAR